jgi:hypothetical protein
MLDHSQSPSQEITNILSGSRITDNGVGQPSKRTESCREKQKPSKDQEGLKVLTYLPCTGIRYFDVPYPARRCFNTANR